MADVSKVTIENARIIFRNFSGKEGQYNRAGDRNFSVILDEDVAKQMFDDGWNVKWLKSREDDAPEGAVGDAYLQVSVNFDQRPPRVVMITSVARTQLNSVTVECLDYADILQVDMILNPYTWVVNGKTGIKAYLQSMYVTIEEDELERKYSLQATEEEGE